jgi:hypothetical protein
MNTEILILLLDDIKEHFQEMEKIINEIIGNEDTVETVSFIYTKDESSQIVDLYHKSMYGGTDNIKSTNLTKLNRLLCRINNNNIIAVIDINWKQTDSANKDGRYFYDKYLKDKIFATNTIFVSFIEEVQLEDETIGFQFVPKIEKDENGNAIELKAPFKKSMRKALFKTKRLAEPQTGVQVKDNDKIKT